VETSKVLNKEAMVGLHTQIKVTEMIQQLVNVGENVILVGSPGSGKHMMVNNILSNQKGVYIVNIECNASTSAFELIRKIQAESIAINSINGKIWKPKTASRFIINIKNLNLIESDA